MDKERYLQIWRSVNDVAGSGRNRKFQIIMNEIQKLVETMDSIEIPYKTRAWTVRAK